MVAFEIPSFRFSGDAGDVVARRRFVKLDANGRYIQSTAGVTPIGASMTDSTKAGEVIDVARGILMIEAAGAIAINAKVASDDNGKAVTYSTGDVAGIAMTSAAAAGELVSVLID
jgi:hypothetical protein